MKARRRVGIPKDDAARASFPVGAWLKDATILVGGNGATLLASILIAVVVARTLGPSVFGIFAACLGASYALATLAQLGLSTWLLRELTSTVDLPARDASQKVSAAACLIATGAAVLPVATGLVTTVIGLPSDVTLLAVALMLYAGCAAIGITLEAALRARRAVGAVVRLNMIEKALLLTAIALWTATKSDHLAILGLAYVGCGAVRLALTAVAVRKAGYTSERVTRAALRAALRSAAPFALAVSSLNITTRLDVVLVGIVSATAAGYYSLGERFIALLTFAPIIASSALYPHLATDSSTARSAPVRVMVLITIIGTVPIAVFAEPIITLTFGPRFAPAAVAMQVMVLSVPWVVVVNAWLPFLYQRHEERRVARVVTPLMIVGSGAIMLMTALDGATGAAAAYAGRALIVAAAVRLMLSRRRPGVDPCAHRASVAGTRAD